MTNIDEWQIITKNRCLFYYYSNFVFCFFPCIDTTLSAGNTMLSSIAAYFEPETARMLPNFSLAVAITTSTNAFVLPFSKWRQWTTELQLGWYPLQHFTQEYIVFNATPPKVHRKQCISIGFDGLLGLPLFSNRTWSVADRLPTKLAISLFLGAISLFLVFSSTTSVSSLTSAVESTSRG